MEEKIIFPESDEAAKFVTLSGWLSRRGHFFGNDERLACYDGSTHYKCKRCGNLVARNFCCVPCRNKDHDEKYKNLSDRDWDGTSPLMTWNGDSIFFDEDELIDFCMEEKFNIVELMLVHTTENRAFSVDPYDVYCDILGEDGDLPNSVIKAFEELNEKLADVKFIGDILSYERAPVKISRKTEEELQNQLAKEIRLREEENQ